jgi:hypothetical protein
MLTHSIESCESIESQGLPLTGQKWLLLFYPVFYHPIKIPIQLQGAHNGLVDIIEYILTSAKKAGVVRYPSNSEHNLLSQTE